MIEIRNDLAFVAGRQVRYVQTEHMGGRIVATGIALHDTAGGPPGDSVSWLKSNPRQASAHAIILPDGAIVQLAPFDRRTNHAYPSRWRGREGCNGFMVGLEIVNPGALLPRGDRFVSSFGQLYDGAIHAKSPAHTGEWWLPYTEAQLDTIERLVTALARAYPTITEVVGHHDVSPGRKSDPTPLMPWPRMRAALASGRAARTTPPPLVPAPIDAVRVQKRLAELGYYDGLIDTNIGPKAKAAVFTFQEQHGLAGSGRLDSVTIERLFAETAKPMPTGTREDATAADVVKVSETAAVGAIAQRDGSIATSIGTVTLLVATFTKLGESLKEAIVAWGGEVVLVALGLGLALWGWRHYKQGKDIIAARLAAFRAGASAKG